MSRGALLRDPALLALLARDTVSLAGSQMTWVALPWFVLTTTGSATKMAVVVAVEAAALGIVGFGAGNLVSRLGARRTMLVADASRAPLMAAIPLLHFADLLSFPLLLVLVFAVGTFGVPSFASKAALLPQIVGEDEGVLGEANALLQISNRVSFVLGPALAGVLIGVMGATTVLLIDAATFAAGFLLIALFVRVGGALPDTDESRGLAAGVRFLFRDRLLRPWSVAIIAGDVAWLAFFVTVPFLVLTRYGDEPQVVGWILGGFGAGAVIGSLVIFRIVRRIDQLLVGSVGEFFMVAPIWLFLADVPPGYLVASMVACGLANGLVNAPIWTIFTMRTPPALRTKAWAAIVAATSLIGPFALLGTGPALDAFGVTVPLLAIFAVQTAAAILFVTAGLRERFRSTVTYEPVA
ncbi:MAG: MFS transporter [Gaiellaceae bacterium]